jgi:DNA-binding IclR family transcriptional regulator
VVLVIQVVSRVGQILGCFTSSRPTITLTECAALSGLNKSSAYRILVSLEEIGLVERHEARWRLGQRLPILASIRQGHLELQREASPRLRELGRTFRAAVAYAVPDGDHMIYIERHESPDQFAPSARLGGRAPMWAGAAGRAVLSRLSAEERERRLDSDEWWSLSGDVRRAVTDEIERARTTGYAADPGGFFEGVAGVAVAVCDPRGEPVATLSVIVTPERLTEREREVIGSRLVATAQELETTMNWDAAREPSATGPALGDAAGP